MFSTWLQGNPAEGWRNERKRLRRRNKNGRANGRDVLAKVLRISPLCKGIFVLKSIFASVFLAGCPVYVYVYQHRNRSNFFPEAQHR